MPFKNPNGDLLLLYAISTTAGPLSAPLCVYVCVCVSSSSEWISHPLLLQLLPASLPPSAFGFLYPFDSPPLHLPSLCSSHIPFPLGLFYCWNLPHCFPTTSFPHRILVTRMKRKLNLQSATRCSARRRGAMNWSLEFSALLGVLCLELLIARCFHWFS